MSQHKYNDAYNKGFKDGKKKAFDDWVHQCYDELSPKEQIELLLSEGAELPRKAVIQVLKEIMAEVKNIPITEERAKNIATYWDCRDDVLDIIDNKIAEVTHESTRSEN